MPQFTTFSNRSPRTAARAIRAEVCRISSFDSTLQNAGLRCGIVMEDRRDCGMLDVANFDNLGRDTGGPPARLFKWEVSPVEIFPLVERQAWAGRPMSHSCTLQLREATMYTIQTASRSTADTRDDSIVNYLRAHGAKAGADVPGENGIRPPHPHDPREGMFH